MVIALRDFMDGPEGWGRAQGRETYRRLLDFVEAHPGVMVFRVSMRGVRRADISFASETLVELARRYRGAKGFCIVDLSDPDLLENWEAAAAKKGQPILVWNDDAARPIGAAPTQGTREALAFALARPTVRAAEFAQATERMSIANASTKFKQLWEQGFLLRRESAAESGGVEYTYHRIG
jgi:hypothetical protein